MEGIRNDSKDIVFEKEIVKLYLDSFLLKTDIFFLEDMPKLGEVIKTNIFITQVRRQKEKATASH